MVAKATNIKEGCRKNEVSHKNCFHSSNNNGYTDINDCVLVCKYAEFEDTPYNCKSKGSTKRALYRECDYDQSAPPASYFNNFLQITKPNNDGFYKHCLFFKKGERV